MLTRASLRWLTRSTKLNRTYQDLLLKDGIEATGDYWRNLFAFLNSLDSEGKLGREIEITMINPNRIAQFKKSDPIRLGGC